MDRKPSRPASYEPTPEEIAAGCREIQSRWPAREERERRKWSVTPAVAIEPVGVEGVEVE